MTDATIAAAVVAALAAIVTAALTRRTGRESSTTAAWQAITDAQREDLQAVRSEIRDLRADVDELKRLLDAEQRERRNLAAILRTAWSYVETLSRQVRELGGHPSPTPPDLTAWARDDGLVVDRVETTISRTMVTDTRDDGDPLTIEDNHTPVNDH